MQELTVRRPRLHSYLKAKEAKEASEFEYSIQSTTVSLRSRRREIGSAQSPAGADPSATPQDDTPYLPLPCCWFTASPRKCKGLQMGRNGCSPEGSARIIKLNN